MTEENPLLKGIKMPGRRFRLPSRGLFYTDGELAEGVTDGEVEVFSLTAIDEISLRSPEFLFNGEAIERVFKRCIPEIKKPLRLVSVDVDFLLTALRVVSYGDVLDLSLRCEKCQEKQDRENAQAEADFLEEVKDKADEQNIPFETALEDEKVVSRIETIRSKVVPKQSYNINLNGVLQNQTIEMSDEEHEKYSFTLKNGQRVVTTPLKMDSAVMSYQFQNEDLSRDLDRAEDYVSFVMAACILSVTTEDGEEIRNPEFILDWSRMLPIELKEQLAHEMGKTSEFGTDFDYKLVCDTCGWERNGNTLLNPITFFILPSDQDSQSR